MQFKFLLALLAVTAAFGQTASSGSSAKVPGFDLKALDRSADPCADFYQYACGGWIMNNPIPADRARWGRFDELAEHNLAILQNILEKAASTSRTRTPVEQKIGDFYASCMDESQIEKLGVTPLQPEFDRIDAIPGKAQMLDELVRLQRMGASVFFSFSSGQDAKDSTRVIAQADQGGMSLPDRDYYTKEDAKSKELRTEFVAHVTRMFQLLGDSPAQAAAHAKAVMDIETGLANGALDNVSRRDPQKTYHKMTVAELTSLCPWVSWPKFFDGMGVPSIQSLNVAEPTFFRTVESVVVQTSLDDLKTYLRWHYLNGEVALLPKAFVDENFAFFGKTLTGAKEIRPRWKRCVSYTDNALGEALGQKYVEETFGQEGKKRTLEMVHAIEKAMDTDLGELPWMTPETKKQARIKLEAVANKIGYPDHWRDYSAVDIKRGDALGNSDRASSFEVHRQLEKIGKPVDKKEWGMTPPTVNAYYDPQMNNINFPAGILQPPFYDNKMDDAVNYGGIGAVIGHELTHGFDDEGRQFDAEGNLKDWWTPEDAKEFEKRAECFVKEYSSFETIPGVHLNGKLTLGENTADNGGLRLAFMALMDTLKEKPAGKIDGYTPEQRFFLGWGQVWCQNQTPEVARLRANVDPHSPGKFRVNGVVSNMPEFQKAFACRAEQPMVRQPACRVW
ncbi:MAG TPA: M13 family metallopeptidase [Bryobacteraceae bacterium]|nr:M13 family metallopeptidase [Bryobacteraceae bacterium]